MSLINKMLQDLEERRAEERGVEGFHAQVRVVPESLRSRLPWMIIAGIAFTLVAAGAWYWGRQSVPAAVPAPIQPVSMRPQLELKLASKLDSSAELALKERSEKRNPPAASIEIHSAETQSSLPEKMADNAPVAATVFAPAAAVHVPARTPVTQTDSALSLRRDQAQAKETAVNSSVRNPVTSGEKIQAGPAKGKVIQTAASKERPSVVSGIAQDQPSETEPVSHLAKQLKELTPQQRAENEYRRAGLLIQQQRTAEAVAALEQALQLDPLHASARQALAGLLIDAKRSDDAMRRLEEGLAADRTQPGLAMMLSRLQVEKKELKPAIDTLQHTLPYAAERADYQAFLAALYQRDGRHKDAIEHYLIALRKTPQNGLWWMGLAISLQADNRAADAREAYNRAKASNMLSADLAMFVDQRLAQLR